MRLYGKLIRGTVSTKESFVHIKDDDRQFHELLEQCLVSLCKKLDIPVPIWLKKNTKEFAIYKTTFFDKEQFVEKVNFDKFSVKWEDDL
jgi:hypothetical protein